MADHWFYAWDGRKLGPFSAQELRALADKGQIQPMDTIWKEGVEAGVFAHQVKNLFASPPADELTQTQIEEPEALPAPAETIVPARATAETEIVINLTAPPADPAAPPPPEQNAEGQIAEGSAPPPEEVTKASTGARGQAKKGRVVSAKGALIMNQDGTSVSLQKKCVECGYLDTSKCTMPIRSGTTRTTFFCRKCRKMRPVEIVAVV